MAKLKKQVAVKKKINWPELIMSIWAFLMMAFPLVIHIAYYDILQVKYGYILAVCGIMLGAILLCQLLKGQPKKLLSEEPKFWKKWSVLDWSMVAFLVISVISTLQAYPYMFQAFFGNEGRYNGMILMVVYVLTYFAVSRNMIFKKKYIIWGIIVMAIVCILGITDYFNLNLLGFKDAMDETMADIFCSTIGNINTFVVFCAMLMALSGVLFVTNEGGIGSSIFFIVTYMIGVIALITGRSDSAYISMAVFFAFFPLIAFKKRWGIKRYVMLVFLLLLSFLVVKIWDQSETFTLPIDTVFQTVAKSRLLVPALIIAGVLTTVLYVLDVITKPNKNALAPKAIWWAWLGIIIVGAVAVVVLFIKSNLDPEWATQKLGSLANVMVFSDEWGTNRGYIWRAGIEEFVKQPIHHIIFGTGPDTFGIYMINNRYRDMVAATSQFYDCAHNEYINYLFTMGITGLIAYLGIVVSTVVLLLKNATGRFRNEMIAIAFLVIVYCSQATVNFAVPVLGGTYWSFLAIAGCLIRVNKDTVIQEKKE